MNRFDETSKTDDDSNASTAKRELDRYLHYYQRYHAHASGQKFAEQQREKTERRMVELQESSSSMTWIDVQVQAYKHTGVQAYYKHTALQT
jgi:ariadne-1